MIYVSSSCVRARRIGDAVKTLAEAGFQLIELSGGTEYYSNFEADLLDLKEAYSLSYLCHNYFPPPEDPFVVNLASQNNSIYEKSLQHLQKNVRISEKLGADRVSFHAGFFIDIGSAEIGRKLSPSAFSDREPALSRFCQGYSELVQQSNLPIYIENNVYSWQNRQIFGSNSPFMLVDFEDFMELKGRIDFHFLLDIGHLQVSCHSLNLNFVEQLSHLFPRADYLHLSDNDTFHDAHQSISLKGPLFEQLQDFSFTNKVITLEICDDLKGLQHSYDLVSGLMNKKATV